MSNDKYSDFYSDKSFWDKLQEYAKDAGEKVLSPALKMYYAATDADTPAWAKAVIFAALGYFISPIDAIPDITPIVGYADDLGVLTATLATVASYIKEEHTKKAKETLKKWFG